MTLHPESYARMHRPTPPSPSPADTPQPPIGETPPHILARDAADGHRGAAWRLMLWVLQNDPRAVIAVSSLNDDRLARHLLEFIAVGTWAGKPFVVPLPLRSAYARTRLRTLFMPDGAVDEERAKRILFEAIYDARPPIRENAACLLGLIGGSPAVPVLIQALQDPAPSVRYQAAKALGHMGKPQAVSALFVALHGADKQLGSQIFLSLIQIGSAAVPALIERYHNSSIWTRWHCIRALGEIHDDRAIPTLAQALDDPDRGVAWMAAKGLVGFSYHAVRPVLHTLIHADITPWLAETACYVLSSLCSRYARLAPYITPVISALHNTTFKIAAPREASRALERMEQEKALYSLH